MGPPPPSPPWRASNLRPRGDAPVHYQYATYRCGEKPHHYHQLQVTGNPWGGWRYTPPPHTNINTLIGRPGPSPPRAAKTQRTAGPGPRALSGMLLSHVCTQQGLVRSACRDPKSTPYHPGQAASATAGSTTRTSSWAAARTSGAEDRHTPCNSCSVTCYTNLPQGRICPLSNCTCCTVFPGEKNIITSNTFITMVSVLALYCSLL